MNIENIDLQEHINELYAKMRFDVEPEQAPTILQLKEEKGNYAFIQQGYVEETVGYLRKFIKFAENPKKKLSWNWAAFLFNISWFVYRRMPLYALIGFFVLLVPLASFIVGALADKMYYSFLKKADPAKRRPPAMSHVFILSAVWLTVGLILYLVIA